MEITSNIKMATLHFVHILTKLVQVSALRYGDCCSGLSQRYSCQEYISMETALPAQCSESS